MRRHHLKEIVENLRFVEKEAASGQRISDCVKRIGVTEVTYYRWQKTFGGLRVERVEWQVALESEITHLRRIVSDLTLDKMILREAIMKTLTPALRSVLVLRVMTAFGISERRACRALGQPRSTQRKINERVMSAPDR